MLRIDEGPDPSAAVAAVAAEEAAVGGGEGDEFLCIATTQCK